MTPEHIVRGLDDNFRAIDPNQILKSYTQIQNYLSLTEKPLREGTLEGAEPIRSENRSQRSFGIAIARSDRTPLVQFLAEKRAEIFLSRRYLAFV